LIRAGVAVVHVLQALVYLCLGQSKGFFTCGALLSKSAEVLFGCPSFFMLNHCCVRQISARLLFACHWVGCLVSQEEKAG
jgi:hypothetical protein